MAELIHLGYQGTKICNAEEFKQLRGIVNRTHVMYPTVESIVMENAKSDFEPVPHNEYETSRKVQVQRRMVCEDTVAYRIAAGVEVNKCKRKYAEHGSGSKKRMKELNDLMKAQRMHYRNLTALVVGQEESIVTHDVELVDLKYKQHIEDSSARCVAELGSSRKKSFNDFLVNLFLVAIVGNGVIACNELQLVAQRIAVLVNTLIHVRALGFSLSRDQVSVLYTDLYRIPVEFSVNHQTYSHFQLFEDTDFENFESQFLASSLVSVGGDNACIVVSNHVFQNSQYGLVKIPEPSKVKSILDNLEHQSVE